MKLDSALAFYQNLKLNQEHLKFVGLSGQPHEELVSLFDFISPSSIKKWHLPDDLIELSQMSLFALEAHQSFDHVEKLKKKDLEHFMGLISSFSGTCYFLSTTSTNVQALYSELKNDMLWLDLSSEKPWQKKDRLTFLLQQEAKNQGYIIDKLASAYIIDNEEMKLDRAKNRLESLMLYADSDKKITLHMAETLLPKAHKDIDFAWIDQLLFKKESLSKPVCLDATDLLLFLGQMRFVLQGALKIKALQKKGISLEQMKEYFPKASTQGLSFQIKKSEEASFDYLEKALMVVYHKEVELKADFSQPPSLFMELVSKITELKQVLIK
jgi:hypothetical protein